MLPDAEVKNRGVEVLLKRMESNPAEFLTNKVSKWGWVMSAVIRRAQQGFPAHTSELPYLSDAEVGMLYDKWIQLQSDWFTTEVLKTLLEEPAQKELNFK